MRCTPFENPLIVFGFWDKRCRLGSGYDESAGSMTVWKRVDNWTYEVFDHNTPPEQFGVFESLVALWRVKRNDRRMPSWADFDFYDFKGWHGWIAVEEIITDPFNLRCRLWGTELTKVLGSDNTGKLYSEYGQGYTENDLAFLTELCHSGSIGMSHGTLDWLQKGHKSAAFIDLPLSDDGSAVHHLLTAFAETDVR